MLLPHRPHSACPRRACAHTASPFGLLPRRLPFTEMHTTPRRGERRECPGERKADRERLRLVSGRFSMNQKTTLISHGQKNYFYFLFASFPAREGFTCLWLHFIYNGVIWGKKKTSSFVSKLISSSAVSPIGTVLKTVRTSVQTRDVLEGLFRENFVEKRWHLMRGR